MTNYNERLDEILAQASAGIGGFGKLDNGKFYKGISEIEAKQAIQAYIDQQVRKARIDEIGHIVSGSEYSADDFCWYEKTRDEYTGTKYYSEVRHLTREDRIAELTKPTTYSELRAEKTEALRPIAKEIVSGLTKGEQE